MSDVAFFSQAASFETLWPLICEHVEEVVASGNRSRSFSQGPKVAALEEAIAKYTGARYTIGVSSGTDALVLLLRACGIGPGDDVVVPAFTFVASASSVALAGARPVFADIDPATYTVDPEQLARAVTPRTRALMPVHLFCQMADMSGVLDLARRHDLLVVEDSAEAIGMRWDGVHAGLLGACGVLSFFPSKTLGAIGDAGMILTDTREIAEPARMLRNHGRAGGDPGRAAGPSVLAAVPGANAKMDEIQAAVLLAKLSRLDDDIARRAELAVWYTELLRDVPGVIRLPAVASRRVRTDPVFYTYVVEVERRDELAGYLARHGIGTEVYYPTPLHLQPCFASLGHRRGDFPHAEAACRTTLALPFYPDLTADQVDRVCGTIRSFFTGRDA